jgi:hypothetical protein
MINFYSRGHLCYLDANNVEHYADGTPLPSNPADERPCVQCGQPPTPEGYDACLGHIPGVHSACCGHGVEDGYILWQPGGTKHPFDELPAAEVGRTRLRWGKRGR